MTFGDWYCFDRPAVMEQIMYEEFKNGGYNYDYEHYAYTYIIFYAPNIVLPMFVGIFMDKFGIRKTLIILSAVGLSG